MFFMINIGINEIAIISVCTLILWGLIFLIYYFRSPFAFQLHLYYSPMYKRLYRIYSNIKPNDRRSRAIYCLIDSLALTIWILVLFIAYIVSNNLRDLQNTRVSTEYFIILVAIMISLAMLKNFLLIELAKIGVIKSIES